MKRRIVMAGAALVSAVTFGLVGAKTVSAGSDGCNVSRGGAFVLYRGEAYCYARVALPGFDTEFRARISGCGLTSTGPWRKIQGGVSSTTGSIPCNGTVYVDKR